MDKCPSVSRSESPLAGICLSESEKAAVLTLIREEVTAVSLFPGAAPCWTSSRGEQGQLCSAWEGGSDPLRGTARGNPVRTHPKGPVSAATQIITKEIEANEWKKKYEESRQEVLEMR